MSTVVTAMTSLFMLVFIGYRGSGKSTLAQALAQQLNLPRYESDQLIAHHAKQPLQHLLATHGWATFRTYEEKVITTFLTQQLATREATASPLAQPPRPSTPQHIASPTAKSPLSSVPPPNIQLILDCGGGVIENENLMQLLQPHSYFIYVTAPLQVIVQRLNSAPRPPLLAEVDLATETKQKLLTRSPRYERYSQYTLTTHCPLATSLKTLLQHLTEKKLIATPTPTKSPNPPT